VKREITKSNIVNWCGIIGSGRGSAAGRMREEVAEINVTDSRRGRRRGSGIRHRVCLRRTCGKEVRAEREGESNIQ
jgi:hypothetical protein